MRNILFFSAFSVAKMTFARGLFQTRAADAAVGEFFGQGFRAAGGAGFFVRAPDELTALALRGAFAQHAVPRGAFFDERAHAFERLP